jgi:hypothetical protein
MVVFTTHYFLRNLRMGKKLVPSEPFQPSLMFEGKASRLPESPERSFTRVGSGLSYKHYTRL